MKSSPESPLNAAVEILESPTDLSDKYLHYARVAIETSAGGPAQHVMPLARRWLSIQSWLALGNF
jgi:hypothetical protein